MTPNSSIHILAESAENTPANLQTGGNDWVDLKERSAEDQADAVTKDGKSAAQTDKVQHEVAALKMAQGLLKGVLSFKNGVCHTVWNSGVFTVYFQGIISQPVSLRRSVK